MKKIFMVFALMEFIVFPYTACADQTSHAYEWQCINKQTNGWEWGDDYFCYVKNNKPHCFLADSKACKVNTTICILGTETNPKNTTRVIYDENYADGKKIILPEKLPTNAYTLSNSLLGYRTCAISYEGSGSDNWYKHYSPKTKAITDCTDTKWKKNDTINKTNEVMVWNNKPVLDDDNTPSEYLVKHYDSPTYPNICVGYYCAGANGKYTEPCDDGTCAADCKKTSDNNSDGGNSGDDSSGGNFENDTFNNDVSGGAGKDKKDVIHRHTVDPWLKALDAYMSSCKK